MRSRLCFILLALLTGSVYSWGQQNAFKQEWSIGAGGGVNFSKVSFMPKVEQNMLMSYHGGITLRWISQKNLGLVAEVNFTQQGWDENILINEENPVKYEYKRTIQYVEIPFMTHIYLGTKRVRFFLNIGPKIGYAISESTSQNINGAEIGGIVYQHDRPIDHKFDWGVCGGPGFELRTGAGSFLLEGRYYYALGDLYGNLKKDYFSKSSEQVISVKLSYLFNLSK